MIKQTNKQTKTLSKHQIKMYFPSEKKLRIFFSLNSHQTNKQTNKWKKLAKPQKLKKISARKFFHFFCTSHKQINKQIRKIQSKDKHHQNKTIHRKKKSTWEYSTQAPNNNNFKNNNKNSCQKKYSNLKKKVKVRQVVLPGWLILFT